MSFITIAMFMVHDHIYIHDITCPASVPVMVLFCPLASKPTANRILAALDPRAGASSLYA